VCIDVTNIIASISVIIAAGAVLVGVNAWRREYVGKRNLDLTEEVLALFYEARDVISYIRSPFSGGGEGSTRKVDPNESPEEKRIYDNAYVAFERFNKHQDLFNKIYSMRYRYAARFGKDAAKPFEDLNKVVAEIFTAAKMLPFYWQRQGNRVWGSTEEFERHLKQMRDLEKIFWAMGKDDEIKPRVDAAVSQIEAHSLSVIRGKSAIAKICQWFSSNTKSNSAK